MQLTTNKFVLFGDSITELCFDKNLEFALGRALQDDYSGKLDILNWGYGGYNSNWGRAIFLDLLKEELMNSEVKILTIFFGTNDARNNSRKVSIKEYKENLEFFVRICLEYQIKPILIGPTLYDEKLANETAIASSIQNLEYSEAAKDVACRLNVPFIDLWYSFQKYGGWSLDEISSNEIYLSELLRDGIHFTSTGYRIFYEQLKLKISKCYPELDSEI